MGGSFGATKSLYPLFGPNRVRDTPISEAGFVGAGVGAAAAGLRPVVDAMWADFTGLAFDQIYNQAGKMSYMFGGQVRLPLTIRVAMGSGLSAAAQHSGTLYSIYTHLPGIKVVVPSTPYDAKGLLLESIFDDSPVHVLRAPEALRREGAGAGGAVPDSARRGRGTAPRERRHHRRDRGDGRPRARGGRAPGRLRHERRGDRPADAVAARRGDDRRARSRRPERSSWSTRARRTAASPPRSRPSSPSRRFDYLNGPVRRVTAPHDAGAVHASARGGVRTVGAGHPRRGRRAMQADMDGTRRRRAAVVVDGAELHVEVAGEGLPLVLVHGLGLPGGPLEPSLRRARHRVSARARRPSRQPALARARAARSSRWSAGPPTSARSSTRSSSTGRSSSGTRSAAPSSSGSRSSGRSPRGRSS